MRIAPIGPPARPAARPNPRERPAPQRRRHRAGEAPCAPAPFWASAPGTTHECPPRTLPWYGCRGITVCALGTLAARAIKRRVCRRSSALPQPPPHPLLHTEMAAPESLHQAASLAGSPPTRHANEPIALPLFFPNQPPLHLRSSLSPLLPPSTAAF
jgi:hypothetical protein